MAEGIAEVLMAHRLTRVTVHTGYDEVRVAECYVCGTLPVYTREETHQAEVLAANGYGKLGQAWDEGYGLGIKDERMSEANIGIAGHLCNQTPCQCKVQPARVNPYRRPE
jgi:hypothetical protein